MGVHDVVAKMRDQDSGTKLATLSYQKLRDTVAIFEAGDDFSGNVALMFGLNFVFESANLKPREKNWCIRENCVYPVRLTDWEEEKTKNPLPIIDADSSVALLLDRINGLYWKNLSE